MTSIFLSYARNDDEAFVRRLHADLTKAGFDVWFDRVSMPARQLTFHQEIRDAIAARDRLLLVVGPGVLTSDYVTQEWRFAYFEAGKCVNPIVRLNGRECDGRSADGAAHASPGIDGYELIPEDLKLLHAEDFRDDAQYDAHLANLIRQLSEAIPPVGKLVAVPELPACFLLQPDRIKALRDLLLVDLQKPVVVSGAAARVGLQGMGGIGKSVLASALAHRPEVRRAFPDGIFWITLGQKPQLAEQQRWLARELGDEALFPDERSGKECLRTLLAGRKALLVLDDVWQREDAEAFNVIGAMGRILLTTRDAGLVTALASKESHYRVELPTEAEAEGIFVAAAQLGPEILPAAREIVAQCGRLPLALSLCGGMVRGGVSPADVLEALREHDLESLSSEHPAEEQHQNAWKAMDVSLRVLPPEQRNRFAELAVFALDRGAPEAAVVTLWEHTGGLTPRHARKLLADFATRSLAQLTPAVEGDLNGARMTLHDLLHNFATGMAEKRFGSLTVLNQTLLDAYRKKCTLGWPSGPDDGYYFQNLCEHLIASGKLDEAVELLTDLPWIEAKSKLVFSLQDDYRNTIAEMPDAQEGLRQEQEWQARLARWTEEITNYSRQWSERRDRLAGGEMMNEAEPRFPEPPPSCRMWAEEEIQAECQRIIQRPTQFDRIRAFARFVAAECYPLLVFGSRPGFVVQHAFNNAPGGPVQRAASLALPRTKGPMLLRCWLQTDQYIARSALLRILEGHSGPHITVSTTPSCLLAVSAGEGFGIGDADSSIRKWDLETGQCLRVIEGSDVGAAAIAMTPSGLRAVSVRFGPLQVWDLEKGYCLLKLDDQTVEVVCATITPDGRRVISGNTDGALKVWDAETGACLRGLEGHTGMVRSVRVTSDGRRAVSGSSDNTLRFWDLELGECLCVLRGHSAAVKSVSLTPDGQRAVSGSNDQTVRVWNTETGECLQLLLGHTDEVQNVEITADGLHVVSAGSDDMLRVWSVESGSSLRAIKGHSMGIASLGISADGRRAISAGHDVALRVWDLEAGLDHRESQENWSPTLEQTHHNLANDRRRLTWSWADKGRPSNSDHRGRLLDLETGACLRMFEGHTSRVESFTVMPDEQHAVSTGLDRTLRVWDLETGICVAVERLQASVSEVSAFPSSSRFRARTSSNNELQFELQGVHKNCGVAVEANEDSEALLRQEIARCLQELGPFHPNTLLGKIALACKLNQVGKTAEASNLRQSVARECLSLNTTQLAAIGNEIHRLVILQMDSNEVESIVAIQGKLWDWERAGFGRSWSYFVIGRLLFIGDRIEEAKREVSEAWTYRGDGPAYVVPRILYFRYLLALLDGMSGVGFIGNIKTVMRAEDAHGEWGGIYFEHRRAQLGEPNCRFLRALEEALSNESSMEKLNEFPEWRHAPEVALD